ncbi:MAG: hypothetical protein ACLQMT_06565 [Candidatus Acidiferrales bacterium]
MRREPRQTEIPDAKSLAPTSRLRRSKRLILDVPLVIRGEAEDKRPFQEETFTVTVSAHGGLVVLANRVALGQKVVLTNPKTRDECEAIIAFLGPPYAGLATVGVNFLQPAPEFWAISSPPVDWGLS